MIVQLSAVSFATAFDAGRARHLHHCDRRGRGATATGIREEGIGAVAEYAAATAFRGEWQPAVGSAHYGSADVVAHDGTELEIKATEYRFGVLFVYDDGPIHQPVILALVDQRALTVELAGYIMPVDARKPEHWAVWHKNRMLRVPCFVIPRALLRPVEELSCFPSSSSPVVSPSAVTNRGPSEKTQRTRYRVAATRQPHGPQSDPRPADLPTPKPDNG